ncbi:hypothetical protein VP01_7651g1, partial [Puccinia sorghi]
TVALINKTLDPVGVDNRSKRVLKQRVFKTPGPNFICHKILGIYVQVTNNDPCHIGYYYLKLVKSCGGIPRRTSTDQGSETIHMASHQINLTAQYNPKSTNSTKSHLFTKSTHNQKIEFLRTSILLNRITRILKTPCKTPPGQEEYASKLLQCRLVLHITRGARWKKWIEGAELMRVSPLWFLEAIGKLVQGIEPPIPVVDIHNVWDLFSSILPLIKAFDKYWISNPSNDPSLTISAWEFNAN